MDNSSRKNNLLPLALLVIGGGLLYYSMTSSDNLTHIPPGANYGGWNNTTGAGVWITAGGQIVDALGNFVGNLIELLQHQNGGGSDNGDGGGILDRKAVGWSATGNYNGGLM